MPTQRRCGGYRRTERHPRIFQKIGIRNCSGIFDRVLRQLTRLSACGSGILTEDAVERQVRAVYDAFESEVFFARPFQRTEPHGLRIDCKGNDYGAEDGGRIFHWPSHSICLDEVSPRNVRRKLNNF